MGSKKNLPNFLFEVGTLRKIPRSHRQLFLTEDNSDNIASHSFRVTIIGWFLAHEEKVDPYKVVTMCMFHDVAETRTGDMNWVHKNYLIDKEDEVIKDQFTNIPGSDELNEVVGEYVKRESHESKVAKDADTIDQILLLKEYTHAGNKEAESWLHLEDFVKKSNQYKNLHTESAKKLAKKIVKTEVGTWWREVGWKDYEYAEK